MSQQLEQARERLLVPAGLDESALQKVLDHLMSHDVDNADLYFQLSRHESWSLEDGIVKEGRFNIDQGVGVRAISGEKTGFAYSDAILLPALTQAADAARSIARSGGSNGVKAWSGSQARDLYAPLDPLASIPAEAKIALLQSVDAAARAADPRVVQVMANIAAVHDTILVAASDGTLAGDIRPLVRMNVNVIVEQNGKREQGSHGGGGRFGYSYFLDNALAKEYAEEAVRQALVNLEAIEAPAGTMDVVLGPGWPGILLHEAVGHGLEGDFNRKGSSAFSGRVGEQVAAKGVTVVDDGSIKDRRGSLNIDDEGTPTQPNVLIEDGILRGYMQDKMNARLMGVEATGNGRRESYAYLPMPRMTNTFMHAGEHDPEEILSSVKKGLYAVNFGGGQVDITSGKFVFAASEAYLIEDGKLTAPVKGATLIGNGPDVMTRIKMIGNDLSMDRVLVLVARKGRVFLSV